MLYTRKLMFVLLLCTCLGAYAQPKRWESLLALTSTINIDKVKTTSKKTDVYFTFTPNEEHLGDVILILSSYKLIDTKGNAHPLQAVKGIDLNRKVVEKAKKRKFRLSFSPLSPEDSIFDITTGQGPSDYFRFFGVRQGDRLPFAVSDSMPVADAGYLFKTPFDANKKYKTCIMGHVEDPAYRLKHVILYSLDLTNSGFLREYKAEVDSSGYFILQTEIYSECVAYIQNTGLQTSIPVYLFPNDTLLVNVSKFRDHSQMVQYKSLHNKVPEKLLKGDPQFPNYDNIYNNMWNFREKQYALLERAKDEIKQFNQYLTWKYHLDSDEQYLHYLNLFLRLEVLRSEVWNTREYVIPQEILNTDLSKIFACRNAFSYLRALESRGMIDKLLPHIKKE